MGYRHLGACVSELEKTGRLIRIDHEVDPRLEVAAIHRRVYAAAGPALLFTRVRNCRFPVLGNLFGSLERTRFLFRDSLDTVHRLLALKGSPDILWQEPLRSLNAARGLLHLLPEKVRSGPALSHAIALDQLPQLKAGPWTAAPSSLSRRSIRRTRVLRAGGHQISGCTGCSSAATATGRTHEVGLHYQLHRGIGVHHAEAIGTGVPLTGQYLCRRPAEPDRGRGHAAAGRDARTGLCRAAWRAGGSQMISGRDELPIPAEADFCITGTIDPAHTLPEGPFGDHLGYYSLTHDFPVLAASRRSTIAPVPSGPLPPSAGRRRRIPPSAPSSMN